MNEFFTDGDFASSFFAERFAERHSNGQLLAFLRAGGHLADFPKETGGDVTSLIGAVLSKPGALL